MLYIGWSNSTLFILKLLAKSHVRSSINASLGSIRVYYDSQFWYSLSSISNSTIIRTPFFQLFSSFKIRFPNSFPCSTNFLYCQSVNLEFENSDFLVWNSGKSVFMCFSMQREFFDVLFAILLKSRVSDYVKSWTTIREGSVIGWIVVENSRALV